VLVGVVVNGEKDGYANNANFVNGGSGIDGKSGTNGNNGKVV